MLGWKKRIPLFSYADGNVVSPLSGCIRRLDIVVERRGETQKWIRFRKGEVPLSEKIAGGVGGSKSYKSTKEVEPTRPPFGGNTLK